MTQVDLNFYMRARCIWIPSKSEGIFLHRHHSNFLCQFFPEATGLRIKSANFVLFFSTEASQTSWNLWSDHILARHLFSPSPRRADRRGRSPHSGLPPPPFKPKLVTSIADSVHKGSSSEVQLARSSGREPSRACLRAPTIYHEQV